MRFSPRKLVFSIIMLLLIGGCKEKPVEFLLGPNKLMNPYVGNETLIFQNDNGDSLIFKGNGRYSYTYEADYRGSTPYGLWINEADNCYFKETKNRYSFEISLGSHAGAGFSMTFTFYQIIGGLEEDACYWYTPSLHSGYNVYISQQASYIDSMEVLNTMHYNIIIDSTYWGSSGSPDICDKYISTSIYSKESGFIKLDFEDGEVWELLEVISD